MDGEQEDGIVVANMELQMLKLILYFKVVQATEIITLVEVEIMDAQGAMSGELEFTRLIQTNAQQHYIVV